MRDQESWRVDQQISLTAAVLLTCWAPAMAAAGYYGTMDNSRRSRKQTFSPHWLSHINTIYAISELVLSHELAKSERLVLCAVPFRPLGWHYSNLIPAAYLHQQAPEQDEWNLIVMSMLYNILTSSILTKRPCLLNYCKPAMRVCKHPV